MIIIKKMRMHHMKLKRILRLIHKKVKTKISFLKFRIHHAASTKSLAFCMEVSVPGSGFSESI